MPELASMPLSKEGFHNFPEDSIQALAQAVGISRQESVESLKHSDGCLERALKQQLCRIRINENLFDKLAIEYGYQRGLLTRKAMLRALSTVSLDNSELENLLVNEETMEQLRKIRQLISEEHISEVLSIMNTINPRFEDSCSPKFLFRLKLCEFVQMVKRQQFQEAICIARKSLGPLTINNPELMTDLKEAILLLVYPPVPDSQLNYLKIPQTNETGEYPRSTITKRILEKISSICLADRLCTSLGETVGLHEPKLITYAKYLLSTHTQWFRKQLCDDVFDKCLMLSQLKQPELSFHVSIESEGDTNKKTSLSTTIERKPTEVDESSILTLMEFMAVSRIEAISYLKQFNGDVETAIASWLG